VFQQVIKPLTINKNVLTYIIFILLFNININSEIHAQKPNIKRKQLEKERKVLLEKISETKKVIAINKQKESIKLTQLKAINAQIKTREKVINNIGQEIFEITVEVDESKTTIDTLNSQLARIKAEYAKNILAIHKNKNNINNLAFIFNAKGFNDANKRIKYLEKLSEYKQLQARLITNIQKEINQEVNKMLQVKKQSEQLFNVKEGEKKELEVDKKNETIVLSTLQQKQKELQVELAKSEAIYQKLTLRIAELIQKEIDEARKREEERRRIAELKAAKARAKLIADNKKKGIETKPEIKKVPTSTLSPEDLKASNDFESMKNRLVWPVNNGFISETFGTHQHPKLKLIKTNNNGVNISCKKATQVICVFKGKVKAILPIPGMETFILIKHGEYFTVYAKLVNVQVKVGQELNVGDVLATVYTDETENKTELHFEIFKAKSPLNPELWLRN
jgi:septal ring factor EnvC (AmiA/AmiB activator)